MADQTTSPAPSTSAAERPHAPAGSRWRCASVYWAAFGVLCLAVQIWVFARWAADGNFHAYPSGGYEISPARKVITHVTQVLDVTVITALAVLHWRQSRALGRVNLEAALLVGLATTFWTSPYAGSYRFAAGNNRYDLNVVSWGPYLPGWNGEFPAAESFVMQLAFPLFQVWIVIALFLVRLLRRHRQHWSRARTLTAITLAFFVLDPLLTQTYTRLGGFSYPRALPHLTLFEGEWYQTPLSSVFGVIFFYVVPVSAMVLYAKRGQEVHLFQGSLELPRRSQPWVRLLAGVGLMNAATVLFQMLMLGSAAVGYYVETPSWLDRPTW
ncbi:spirocyclase AveC family protein [Streptomyces himalayensis]|uniref:Spirocyclase AveC family protein n=1 Tax=Streptomyces himalayensis subsp. himalayensis TaxID=2756131 RepID=A0A7W0DV05_9ACTN|nr:spirocyclase AveC family protein [Streptomyces himalayensis]MBA2951796.1 spirocyclase AveC family protein [Streptomyces himalayensis subsp. himalayensis]